MRVDATREPNHITSSRNSKMLTNAGAQVVDTQIDGADVAESGCRVAAGRDSEQCAQSGCSHFSKADIQMLSGNKKADLGEHGSPFPNVLPGQL
jgi:hypothetical protein